MKNAGFIIAARGISDFGAFLNMVALSTYVYFMTNSVFHVGVFLACRVTGGVLASIIGTLFFRKYIGKFSLVIFDCLRACLLFLLVILPPEQQIIALPFVALGIGFGNSMFSIGLNTQIPYFIEQKNILSVTSWISSVSATGCILGALISGIIVAVWGYHIIFIINIMTYLTAAFLILPLKIKYFPDLSNKIKPRFHERKLLLAGLKNNKILAAMLIITLADTFGSAAHNVGFPIFSRLITPATASKTMGMILAVWALGKFGGARLAGFFLRHKNVVRMERLFAIGVLIMSTGFILLFRQNYHVLLFLFALLAGVGDGLSEVSLISRVQCEQDELRLPIFSALTLFQMTGFGVGMLLVTPFFSWWQPSNVVLFFHAIPIFMVTMMLILYKNIVSAPCYRVKR